MNYHDLKSLIAGKKSTFTMRTPSNSFCVAAPRKEPFIPPTFSKVEYATERPPVILISAVGASGKSTLAQVLSSEAGLPLLDLGKHKPVAEDSLTGLLAASFLHQDLGAIMDSLGQGTYGIIIDGVDEARAKTTEKGFEAFLDNIATLCPSQPGTSFVLLGRSEVLEYCWYYLTDKDIQAALITIESFSLESARDYIDRYTPVRTGHVGEYQRARDEILEILAGAFERGAKGPKEFLSFIGYPPVLDAVVTLLREEPNYYKLLEGLKGNGSSDVEFDLLHRIASYILNREKEEKVRPNILTQVINGLPESARADTLEKAYDVEEQCIRLVSWVVNRPVALKRIQHPVCDQDYEKALSSFLPEHPFLAERRFRNAVFESFALATLMVSQDPNCSDLLSEYVRSHKYNYHLIYLLDAIAAEKSLPLRYLGIILGSAMEFRSSNSTVELRVDGPAAGDSLPSSASPQDVQIEISIVLGKDGTDARSFVFSASSEGTSSIELGPRLSTAYVTLPCEVTFNGGPELEFTAPVEVSAGRLNMAARELILRRSATADEQDSDSVILEAESITSNLVSIVANDVPLAFVTSDRVGLTYPAINYVEKRQLAETDPLLQKKYFRLRRILLTFRSHKRGTLARFREKIEDERVMGYGVGDGILRRLLKDGVIRLEGQHYFLEPENLDRYLGISWLHLRLGHTSEKLLQYLRSVE